MAEYAKGGYIGGKVTAHSNNRNDEPVLLSRGVAYFSPEAIKKYGRKFLEELFPNTEIQEY